MSLQVITIDNVEDARRPTSSSSGASSGGSKTKNSRVSARVIVESESDSEKDEMPIRAALKSDNSNDGDYKVFVL